VSSWGCALRRRTKRGCCRAHFAPVADRPGRVPMPDVAAACRSRTPGRRSAGQTGSLSPRARRVR
jgi:hypothetical protein